MNGLWKFGLVFLGGLVFGSVIKNAASSGSLRPAASRILGKGLEAKECVMAKVETLKENVQDFVAEAQSSAEKRKESAQASKAAPKA